MIIFIINAWFGLELFDLSTSAYATAMGKAFSATNKGAHSIWYNPAGIFKNSIILTHNRVFNLYNFNFVGFSYTKAKFATSMCMANLEIDSIPEHGEDIPSKPISYGSDKQNVIIVGLGYHYKINLAMNVKYISHTLFDKQAKGFGVDIGTNYKYKNGLIAIVIKDVGHTKIKWNTKNEDKRKMTTILGINYNWKNITLATDIGYQGYYNTYLENLFYTLGAEYSIKNILFIRAGFNKYLTCGLGIIIKKITIDYAFQMHPLKNYHLFTASLLL